MLLYTAVQKLGVGFWKKSLIIIKNTVKTVKHYYNLKLFKIEFIPVIQSWIFSIMTVSHDPLEIILICDPGPQNQS